MNHQIKIYILEDDLFFGKMIQNFLMNEGFENVELFQDEDECISAMKPEKALIIMDHHLIHSTGIEVMDQIKEINDSAQFIYLSGQEHSNIAIKALRSGAMDYIEKNKDVLIQLKKSLEACI